MAKAQPKKQVKNKTTPKKGRKVQRVFEDTVVKKPKTVKPTVRTSEVIEKMAKAITQTFS
jgi:hypothetical protein